MRITEINRSILASLKDEISEHFEEIEKKYGIRMSFGNSSFSSDSAVMKIDVSVVDKSGKTVVSDTSHTMANYIAEMKGVKFEGNIIGSRWSNSKGVYEVTDVVRTRPRYPFSLRDISDGTQSKCSAGFLTTSKQLATKEVTLDDFKVWLSTDIEDDRVDKKTEEIYDFVNELVTDAIPSDDYENAIFSLMNGIDEKGFPMKRAKEFFDILLIEKDMDGTVTLLKEIYYGKGKKTSR